jgi:hypothetical protein
MQQIELPKLANEWTLPIIESLVNADYFETDSFDFKEFLVTKQDPKHKLRICKTACAFANSNGGFIIFGVADRDSGKRGRDRIVGIDQKLDMAKCFGDQIGVVEPTILYTPQNPAIPLPNSDKAIFVIHIPRSRKAPHTFVDDGKYWFCKRTNRGNEEMSYAEIEEAFTLKSQTLSKLMLLNLELANMELLLPHLQAMPLGGNKYSCPLAKLDYGLLDVLASELYPTIGTNRNLLDQIYALKIVCMVINSLIEGLPIETVKSKNAFERYNEQMNDKVRLVSDLITAIRKILRDEYEIQEIKLS